MSFENLGIRRPKTAGNQESLNLGRKTGGGLIGGSRGRYANNLCQITVRILTWSTTDPQPQLKSSFATANSEAGHRGPN